VLQACVQDVGSVKLFVTLNFFNCVENCIQLNSSESFQLGAFSSKINHFQFSEPPGGKNEFLGGKFSAIHQPLTPFKTFHWGLSKSPQTFCQQKTQESVIESLV